MRPCSEWNGFLSKVNLAFNSLCDGTVSIQFRKAIGNSKTGTGGSQRLSWDNGGFEVMSVVGNFR